MSFVKIHSYKDQRFKFALGIQVNKFGLIINRITLNITIHQINGAIPCVTSSTAPMYFKEQLKPKFALQVPPHALAIIPDLDS